MQKAISYQKKLNSLIRSRNMAIGSRIEWIEHKGKPILVNDLKGLTDKEKQSK